MRRLLTLVATAALVAVGFTVSPVAPQPATEAAPAGSAFDPGLIISDPVFYDFGTMSVGDIQKFLDSRVETCRADSTGPACLKDYREDILERAAETGRCNAIKPKTQATAAEIIYTIANACGINPKVLIVTLQKEQGLVTSTKPTAYMYRAAMGYGCPDSDPAICGKVFVGLSNQLFRAASQLRWYGNPEGSFTYLKPGKTVSVRYSPKADCGTRSFEMKSQATANLYYYTPYTPNQAALDNLYGTGDGCSAYGNRNFWRFFHDWFGSPISGSYLLKSANSQTFLIVNASKYLVSSPQLTSSLRTLGPVGEISQGYLDSFSFAGEMNQLVKDPDGVNYLLVDGSRYKLEDCSIASHYGVSCSTAIPLTTAQLVTFADAGILTRLVQASDGKRYWIDSAKSREVLDDVALTTLGVAIPKTTKLNVAQLAKVTVGSPLASDLQLFSIAGSTDRALSYGGKIYRLSGSLVAELPVSNWFKSSTATVSAESVAAMAGSATVTGIVANSRGEGYLLSPNGRVVLQRLADWTSTPVILPDAVLAKIPLASGSINTPGVVKSSTSGSLFYVRDGLRRTIKSATTSSLLQTLHGQSEVPTIPNTAIAGIAHGGLALAPGSALLDSKAKKLYLVDGFNSLVALTNTTRAKWATGASPITTDPKFFAGYTTRKGISTAKVSCGGTTMLLDDGELHPVGTDTAMHFPGTAYTLDDSTCISLGVSSVQLGQFVRTPGKTMYLVAGGQKYKISNWSAYQALLKEGAIGYRWVSDHFVSLIPSASTGASASLPLALNDRVVLPKFGGTSASTPTPTPTASPTTTASSSATPTPTQVPAPTPTPSPTSSGGFEEYKVVSGDTLSKIATRFGVTVTAIMQANGLSNANYIYIGQLLRIPTASSSATLAPTPSQSQSPSASPTASSTSPATSEETHVVVSGDSLWSIARKYSTTVTTLQALNQISNPNLLRIGQVIRLP